MLGTQVAAVGSDYGVGSPFARLFDTGSASSRPLSARTLAARRGWTLLPEDDVAHEFRGDAVLQNDKLVVVLRAEGRGAEVYSRTPAGARHRATLLSLPAAGRSIAGLQSVTVVENHPGAVMLEATYRTAAGSHVSITHRLTTGQQILEVRPGEAADRLVVWTRPRRLIVPDFLGDDMVFGPEAFDRSRHGLPTEGCLLSLLGDGDAMLMCTWRTGREGADALLFDGEQRREIGGCEIRCRKDQSVWIALMEGKDIWHERTISAGDAQRDVILDWRPPFAAKWRADLPRSDGVARSWNFAPQRSPDRPCWFDADRATVRMSAAGNTTLENRSRSPLVVYCMDRTPATPLTAFTPVDVLRNTLGVGPCQYILQTEGLASETNATPDQVIRWIERQFKRKQQQQSAQQIQQRLGQMVEHVRRTQARIGQYAHFAGQIRKLCAAERPSESPSPCVSQFSRIAEDMERAIATGGAAVQPARRASELAGRIVELIGTEDPLAECERLGAEVRRIGAAEDRTLSMCRMAVRWLEQRARMSVAGNSSGAELARQVRARAERFLHDL